MERLEMKISRRQLRNLINETINESKYDSRPGVRRGHRMAQQASFRSTMKPFSLGNLNDVDPVAEDEEETDADVVTLASNILTSNEDEYRDIDNWEEAEALAMEILNEPVDKEGLDQWRKNAKERSDSLDSNSVRYSDIRGEHPSEWSPET